MSGLIASLASATRALDAQQYGLDITGQNIANLNTDGYVRRTTTLAEVPPTNPNGAGGGVTIVGATAQRDYYLEGRILDETPPEQQQSAIADSLSVVQTSLGAAGSSLDASLTSFFDAWRTLSEDSTSSISRDGVVLQGKLLAGSFNDMARRLGDAQRSADTAIRSGVAQLNNLSQQVAKLNESIGGANGANVESVKDQQAVLLNQMAQLTSITVLRQPDGTADVTLAKGEPLVVGANPYALNVTSAGGTGLAVIKSGGVDITSELTSGKIGGLLQVRDTLVPDYVDRLDQIAYAVVDQVNTAHAAGYDANGNTGNNFFTPLGSASGAAAAIAVDPTLAGDSTMVAASQTGTAGDNQVAKTIADLRDARVMNGNSATFGDSWSQLVYQVGNDAKTAQLNQQNRSDVLSAIQTLKDSISGVSLDEEAGEMLKFQRAYQANAQFFGVVSSTLDMLMSMVKG
jgi:flagellar hook-associated protein 1 FlgK